MNTYKKLALAGLCIVGGSFFTYIVSGSSNLAGYAEGAKAGEEVGFLKGRIYQALITKPAFVPPAIVSLPRVEAKRDVKDFWVHILYKDKSVFRSEYATPPLLSEFGIEEVYHYFYGPRFVYAFPVGEFDIKEIYELVADEKPPVEKKSWGNGRYQNL